MSISDGILESLIQDGRTIELIQSYLLQCCSLNVSVNELKQYINNLYSKKFIKIAFPPEYINSAYLDERYFDEYWFDLTAEGEQECIKRGLMICEDDMN